MIEYEAEQFRKANNLDGYKEKSAAKLKELTKIHNDQIPILKESYNRQYELRSKLKKILSQGFEV